MSIMIDWIHIADGECILRTRERKQTNQWFGSRVKHLEEIFPATFEEVFQGLQLTCELTPLIISATLLNEAFTGIYRQQSIRRGKAVRQPAKLLKLQFHDGSFIFRTPFQQKSNRGALLSWSLIYRVLQQQRGKWSHRFEPESEQVTVWYEVSHSLTPKICLTSSVDNPDRKKTFLDFETIVAIIIKYKFHTQIVWWF